jgi:hypothetical protein
MQTYKLDGKVALRFPKETRIKRINYLWRTSINGAPVAPEGVFIIKYRASVSAISTYLPIAKLMWKKRAVLKRFIMKSPTMVNDQKNLAGGKASAGNVRV